jgi:hypothetical protein
VRWFKLGGENTKFLHSKATERYRFNRIAEIQDDDGNVLSDNQDKANAFWLSYKGRMGVCVPTSSSFALSDILHPVDNLDSLIAPFSEEEISGIVKFMKPDRAFGPDGFNGLFLKKCWHIVKEDFIHLCNEFHAGNGKLQSINGSFITPVPKTNAPETVNDFRPISLTNTCLKFLTKLAANRMQEVIKLTIHVNQYGFIKDRTIQDCLAWDFEYIHQCQQSKRKIVVIKIDFEKAFDTLDHEAIIQIMRAKGYPDLFLQWVREVLSSGSSSILLNGVPGKSFHCKRGVRQGDPLSPLLFVQGADLLQSLVNWALRNGMLSLPIPIDADFPIIQYADDTIIVLPADLEQLIVFKDILNQYAAFTGLKVNYHKSSMIPINLSKEDPDFWQRNSAASLGLCLSLTYGYPWGLPNHPSKIFHP